MTTKISSVFSNTTTSSAIIYLNNYCTIKRFEYFDIDFNENIFLEKKSMKHNKWLFSNKKIEKGNVKFSDHFEVANSVATLFNETYVIKQYEGDVDQKLIKVGDSKIEKNITKIAGSPDLWQKIGNS